MESLQEGWKESALFKLNEIDLTINDIPFSCSNDFKSREEITSHTISLLDLKNPKEIIYFGDGEWDYKTCKKLGIRFIGIDSNKNGKLKKLGAKEIYENFLDADKILNRI